LLDFLCELYFIASARTDKGFKCYVWPKNNEVEQRTIFIYLFIYWIPPYNTWDLMSFFLNTEAVLKLVEVSIYYSFKPSWTLFTW